MPAWILGSAAFLYIFAIGWRIAGPVCGLVAVSLLFLLVDEQGLRNITECAVFLAYAGAVFHFLAWRKSGPDSYGQIIAMALFFVLGFVAKPSAVLSLPVFLALAALLKREDQVRVYFHRRGFLLAAVLAVALIGGWLIYEYQLYGHQPLDTIRGEEVYLDPANPQPWHFHLAHLWGQLRASGAAWIVAAGAALVLWRTARHRWLEGALMILWFAVPLTAISMWPSELIHYAHPVLPPVALAGGCFIAAFIGTIWRGVRRGREINFGGAR